MPRNKHFGGHGSQVMKSMEKAYGKEKAERIFYATESKMKKKSPMAEHLNTLKAKGKLKSKKTKY